MIEFYFGTRVVGTISRAGGTGIGRTVFERGVIALDEMRHYTPADGQAFLDAVCKVFSGQYFKAYQTG